VLVAFTEDGDAARFLMNAIDDATRGDDGDLTGGVSLHRLFDVEGGVGHDPAAGRVEAGFGLDALSEDDGGGVVDLFVEGCRLRDRCLSGRHSNDDGDECEKSDETVICSHAEATISNRYARLLRT